MTATALPAAPKPPVHLDTVADAVGHIKAGHPVVVIDDADRENEGDLVFAADAATPDLLAFTIRHSSGIICVPTTNERADLLDLPRMTGHNQDPHRTAFTVSVDAREGVTTGVSAADRAHTIRLLAQESTTAQDLTRPGHVFPLRAHPQGVRGRRGHTEATVELVRLAGRGDTGVLVELVHDNGTMMRAAALREFADQHGLPLISVAQLADHLLEVRGSAELLTAELPTAAAPTAPAASATAHIELTEGVHLPTAYGDFTAFAAKETLAPVTAASGTSSYPAGEHLVLVTGDVRGPQPVLVRVHSECVTGDVLGSRRCDCGPQLNEALRLVQEAGRGVVILMRNHEGRGIGLWSKIRAYALQDAGCDTVEANLAQGLPNDSRDFSAAGEILHQLGVGSVQLITHNPDKVAALRRTGFADVTQVHLPPHVTIHNAAYLRTKRDKLGHVLPQNLTPPGETP